MITLIGLNWAQWGVTACSLGVVIFTLFATAIQKRDARQKDATLAKKSEEIVALSKQNLDLSSQIQLDQGRAAAPKVTIESVQIRDGKYIIRARNSGLHIAEDVQLIMDYSYAPEIILKTREIAPGTTYDFSGDIFPFSSIPVIVDNFKYDATKKALEDGSKALVLHVRLSFSSKGTPVGSSEYTIVKAKDGLYLN